MKWMSDSEVKQNSFRCERVNVLWQLKYLWMQIPGVGFKAVHASY